MEDWQKSGLLTEILQIILANTKLNTFWQEEEFLNVYSQVKNVTLNHLVSEKPKKLDRSIMAIVVRTRD